jgi:hypothetical protein
MLPGEQPGILLNAAMLQVNVKQLPKTRSMYCHAFVFRPDIPPLKAVAALVQRQKASAKGLYCESAQDHCLKQYCLLKKV